MGSRAIKVLYGDSTGAMLPPDILDVVVRLVDCVVDVATAYGQTAELERQEREGSAATDQILAHLDGFQAQVEVGLTATVQETLRGELEHHGTEVVGTVLGLVDRWRTHYLRNLEEARGLINNRKSALLAVMRDAVVRFVLPLAPTAGDRVVERKLDGLAYRDQLVASVVPGLCARLALSDREPEIPRRLRTLVGKGAKIQIGTKISRIRKIEEPAIFSLDDQVVLEASIAGPRAHLSIAKKAGASSTIGLELAPVEGGTAAGRGTRPDGDKAVLPDSDGELVLSLWRALQAEAERIARSPAKVLGLTLDNEDVVGAVKLLSVVERLVEHYRPIIAAIADRSPNVEELAIKHETEEGRREEVWIKRAALGQRLATLAPDMLRRVGIVELYSGEGAAPVPSLPAPAAITQVNDGENSKQIVVKPPPPPPVGPGAAAEPGVPTESSDTEDISLLDLDLLVEEISAAAEDGCTEPPRVRSRES